MHRIWQNTLKNIRRSPYQALAAVLVLTVTFFIGFLFTILSLGSHQLLNYFETRPQVSAYFKDEASPSAILLVKNNIEALPFVSEVKYISKEDALNYYRQQNSSDPLLLEMVTAEILPASLEVSAKSVENLPDIKTELEKVAEIEEVVYQQDVIDGIKKWTKGLRITGIGLLSILSLTSLLIITIIISMKVSAKRKEITIMQLLGAESWYVKGPFIMEGMLYGVVAALISWGTVYLVILYSTPYLVDFLGDIPLLPIPILTMLLVLFGGIIGGLMIGMIAGLTSSQRFIRKLTNR